MRKRARPGRARCSAVLEKMEVLWMSAAFLLGLQRRQAVSSAVAAREVSCGLATRLFLGTVQKTVCQHSSFQFLRNILPPVSSVLLKVIVGVEFKLTFIWVIVATPVSLHLTVN